MKLEQDEFTGTLKGKIVEAERKFEKLCAQLNQKYHEPAAERNLDLSFVMKRKGHDSFSPYYHSDVTIGIARNNSLLVIHRIVIWECRREILGMQVKWNIPGSKVVGEYLDVSFEHAARELEEHAKAYLHPNNDN